VEPKQDKNFIHSSSEDDICYIAIELKSLRHQWKTMGKHNTMAPTCFALYFWTS